MSASGPSPALLGGLKGLVIAVVGGDQREREIARLAAQAGAVVRAYGFPWPDAGIPGVELCPSAGEALGGAHYALFPIPGMADDGSLYAPDAPTPIVPGAELLARLEPGGAVIVGRADAGLKEAAAQTGTELLEYEDDDELMLMRGPAIVEGLLAVAITNSDVTLHASAVGVVGFGNIGALLARALYQLGAKVHVFARNPVQRAQGYALGCATHPLEQLAELSSGLAMLFSTVPAPVVGESVLGRLAPGSLVVDIAAPPGSIDLGQARRLGLRAVWARGMGRSAPVTVGASQWAGIVRRISAREAGRTNERSGPRAATGT